ncbi:MAG TPA: hypothetical protein VKR31_03155, partial [Rhizomicrobium sp.]|nr:hypothetical protein [Rhizomicrobium sp.]
MPEILTLPWLVEAPTDFAERCQRLPGIKTGPGTEAQALATFRLSASQSAKLTRRLRKMQAQQTDLSPLLQFRLGVLASNTFDLLLDLIPAAAARHGIALEIETSAYDQVVQEALDPGSIINRSRCDAVLVAVDHRWFGLERLRVENPAAHVAAAVQQLRCIIDALRASGGAPTILQTVPVPPLQLFGSFDRRLPGTIRFMLDETNRAIGDLAADTGSYLLDVAAMAERIGTDLWFSPVHWHAYKLPFSPECFPAYADLLGRLLGAIRGRTRKCL